MGWDDNGLNVERRVQILTGTRCDPSLPYDPDFRPPENVSQEGQADPGQPAQLRRAVRRGRRAARAELLRPVVGPRPVGRLDPHLPHHRPRGRPRPASAASSGWSTRDLAYRSEAPTLWDVDFRSAVAQAEMQDREIPGAYHKIRFDGPDGQPIWIETTRPELLPACVALVAHPDDERYQPLFGKTARTPLFGVDVPIVAHELAAPDKGTGIAMICTFGDTTDVTWWRELRLALRAVVQRDGRLRPVTWGEPGWESADPAAAQAAYDELAGRTVKQAQARIVELLLEAGLMEGEPRPITHPVKFWENGTRPLEIVTSNQWMIRYPDKEAMLARGREIAWWPEFMRVRYENWVNGLQGDWNVTRQRFFGVPFPAWYPIDEDGVVDYLVADPRRRGQPPRRPHHRAGARVRRAPARQARRVHGRPRRDGHLGHVVADAADRHRVGGGPRPVRPHVPHGHAAPGARHHPHLALLHGRPLALRARRHPVDQRGHLGLHRRPRPQEAVEVGGQRPRRPRRADRAVRRRRRALLGGQRPPGHGRRVRRGPAQDRPQARHQAAQRLEVRARASGPPRPARSPSPWTGRCWPRWPTSSPRPPPPSTASTTPGRSSAPRASSGRSATTTSSW